MLCFGTLSAEQQAHWHSSDSFEEEPLHVTYLPSRDSIVSATVSSCGAQALQLHDAASLRLNSNLQLKRTTGAPVTAMAVLTLSEGTEETSGSTDTRELLAVAMLTAKASTTIVVLELLPTSELQPCYVLQDLPGSCYNLASLQHGRLAVALDSDVHVLMWRKGSSAQQTATAGMVECCRTGPEPAAPGKEGAITAMSTCGNYLAVARLLHSITVYRLTAAASESGACTVEVIAHRHMPRYFTSSLALYRRQHVDEVPMVAVCEHSTQSVSLWAVDGSSRKQPAVLHQQSCADMLCDGLIARVHGSHDGSSLIAVTVSSELISVTCGN